MNILDQIVEQKRREVSKLPPRPGTAENLAWVRNANGLRRPFLGGLRIPRHGSVALVAEVKKASPSAGVICPDFDPVAIARAYEAAGASCLSVLTDEPFFQGSLAYLRAIRNAVQLPLLRKDFILNGQQIIESIEWGADAILLIVSILTDAELQSLHDLAKTSGLAVLVEVHNETELERALAIDAELIGINNRDLTSFSVDLGTTERLAKKILDSPGGRKRLIVAESGIHSRADVDRVTRAGARAILVGESIMRNGAEKVHELLST